MVNRRPSCVSPSQFPQRVANLGLVILMIAAAYPATAVEGTWIKLSSGASFSDVGTYTLSPDGRYVVYTHDANVVGAQELYRVSVFGGEPIRLSGLLPGGYFVDPFSVTPDSSRVVYRSPEITLNVYEIFSVSIDGGAPVRLNGDLVSGGSVSWFELSPDGSRVVYLADQDENGVEQLYSVPVGGGSAIRINGDLAAGGEVRGPFEISPDGSRVVYTADQQTASVIELFSVPITGGSSVKLNGAVAPGGRVRSFSITPDSARVVYRADQQSYTHIELYSSSIAGGGNIRLSAPAGDNVDDFLISPDGTTAVYRTEYADSNHALFSVPVTGGSPVELKGTTGGDLGVEPDYLISADSSRVVYRFVTWWISDWAALLYSVPISGGSSVRLNGDLTEGGSVDDFRLAPDGSRVVYRADQTVDGWPMGYQVDIAGPAGSGEVIWTRPWANDRNDYAIDSTGNFAVVLGFPALGDSIERLWRVPLTGTPEPLGIELIPGSDFHPDGDVRSFILGTDGTVVYMADQIIDQCFELFAYHPPLFADGFETGNLAAWSDWSP